MRSLASMAQSANSIVISTFDRYSSIGDTLLRYNNATYLYSSIIQSNVYDQRTKMMTIVAGTGLAIFTGHLIYRDICSVLKRSKKKQGKRKIKRVTLIDASTMTEQCANGDISLPMNEVVIAPTNAEVSNIETEGRAITRVVFKDAEMVDTETDAESVASGTSESSVSTFRSRGSLADYVDLSEEQPEGDVLRNSTNASTVVVPPENL